MGELLKFPDVTFGPCKRLTDPATVIVLPVIKIERAPRRPVSPDIEKLRIAARRYSRKRAKPVQS
jgi:hypothetical protein